MTASGFELVALPWQFNAYTIQPTAAHVRPPLLTAFLQLL